MKIVWDEIKRQANLDKHGLDFADLDAEFFSAAVIRLVKFGRYSAIGPMDTRLVTVIFARLGNEGLSIISMRPASVKERKDVG